ncbi:hypothetical protein PR048_025484 [Dryococelus australis]|uniref:Uncharacterized protein n=1 Tax=Dryococelus australis TaxID=614101 RepID=A0ABQ9GRI1_9NEOP|nr:hypothetical protein PR048_025484 [Dryococelus australis]
MNTPITPPPTATTEHSDKDRSFFESLLPDLEFRCEEMNSLKRFRALSQKPSSTASKTLTSSFHLFSIISTLIRPIHRLLHQ